MITTTDQIVNKFIKSIEKAGKDRHDIESAYELTFSSYNKKYPQYRSTFKKVFKYLDYKERVRLGLHNNKK